VFYVLICITVAPYSLASCLTKFSSLHTCFPFTSLKCCCIDNRLDMLYDICIIASPYSLASCLTRFSSLHTCSSFTSPRFMHYPRCNTLPVRTRNFRVLQRHFRDVAPRPPRITDITLSRMTVAPVAICPGIGTRSR